MEARGKNINIHLNETTYQPTIKFVNICDDFFIKNQDKVIRLCDYYLGDYKYKAITEDLLQNGVNILDPFFESVYLFLNRYTVLRDIIIDELLE